LKLTSFVLLTNAVDPVSAIVASGMNVLGVHSSARLVDNGYKFISI
jgi:hypothetical protein